MPRPLVIQIGNQTAPHATEAAYRDGYEHAGCEVLGIDQAEAFERGPDWFLMLADANEPALVVYSRTHNNTALDPEWTNVWRRLEGAGTRTAGAHLDVFWGIAEREQWIASGDPMFTLGTVFTADGGSDEKWAEVGVNHQWLPPAMDSRFLVRPEPIPDLAGKVVFVGSSMGYHPIYPMRDELVRFARDRWPDRFVEYGNGTPNGPVRGANLCHIYASDCVVLGDSCFAGQRANYWSDRVPETLGRGGLLMHPRVHGMDAMYEYGADLLTWTAGDFDNLADEIDEAEGWGDGYRNRIRSNGRFVVGQRDTYRHRAAQVLDAVGIEVEA